MIGCFYDKSANADETESDFVVSCIPTYSRSTSSSLHASDATTWSRAASRVTNC